MAFDTEQKPKDVEMKVGPFIKIKGAHLRYPVARDKSSLKSLIFGAVGSKNEPQVLKDYIHAIRNVSLTIETGERVGIIGSNGAGKSTILRAIANVYPLDRGSIEVRGKIQGLFELGVGFEPEATGRENIIFRGLAIGCSPEMIAARTDEIIDFAGLGEFIDYPLRTYSAGMGVRLGFAISAYLDGDILLIDEVFGAGDANFQERARRRLTEVISQTSILVIVSHDLGLMQSLCTRVVWMKDGRVVADGEPASIVAEYLEAIK
jgi:lipopolysaccharide transport system ATP-binding protein